MRTFTEGEGFLYRGAPVRLCFERADGIGISGDRLVVPEPFAENTRQKLLFWYTGQTESILFPLLSAWTKKLGLRPSLVTVRNAKTRWGSCTSSGKLFFNSRIAMLSDDVAEYLVVHELCHLRQMNHSSLFWREVEDALPGCRMLRNKLKGQEKFTEL